MSVVVAALVVAAVLGAIVFPIMLVKGFVAHLRHGGGNGFFGRPSPDDYRDKTQDDLENQTLERVMDFLDKHGISYERDKEFVADDESVTVPFYLTERETCILLDDWYKEYLVNKYLELSTVIVEPHTTEEYQYDSLRIALGVEKDWRDAVEWSNGVVSDAEVLGVDLDDASFADVRDAYRDRIMETHPDLNDSPNAEEEFMRVKEAYENLKEEVDTEPG